MNSKKPTVSSVSTRRILFFVIFDVFKPNEFHRERKYFSLWA